MTTITAYLTADDAPGVIHYRGALDSARETLAICEEGLAAKRAELAALPEPSAAADFRALARGDVATAEPDRKVVEQERDRLDALVNAGRGEIERLEVALRRTQLEEQQRRAAAMSITDAIAFAGETLATINTDAASTELAMLEAVPAEIAPALQAAMDEAAEARDARDRHHRRFGDREDRRTGARFADLAAAAQTASEAVIDLNSQRNIARRRHGSRQEELKAEVAGAFVHAARIIRAAVDAERKKLDAAEGFARQLQMPYPGMAAPPAVDPIVGLNAPELSELIAAANSILGVTLRPWPAGGAG